jgi:hypothetical protein
LKMCRMSCTPRARASLCIRPRRWCGHRMTLHLGCCMRLVVRLVHQGCCMRHVTRCLLPCYASYLCCVLNVACGGLHATCFMPPVSCCACCMLRAVNCMLRAASTAASGHATVVIVVRKSRSWLTTIKICERRSASAARRQHCGDGSGAGFSRLRTLPPPQ